jgi:hypothetical protein
MCRVVPAQPARHGVRALCPRCGGWHSHGPGPGRRFAPCGRGHYTLVSAENAEAAALLNALLEEYHDDDNDG